MAHAATLSALADALVTAVTGRAADNDAATFRKLKDAAVRGMRDQSRARTNQFAIQDKLHGLVEKFAILNREDLADALHSRLENLPTQSDFVPDVLALLLELSDQPAVNTSLQDVQNANQTDLPVQHITREEILADDPFDETDIWETIERGYHSSGDEDVGEASEPTVSTTATSIEDDSPAASVRSNLVQSDDRHLSSIKDAYKLWDSRLDDTQSLQLPEITVTRDMLLMLRGLPTDIFQKDVVTGRVSLSRRVHISTASRAALLSVLQSAADDGTALNALRYWVREPQDLAYVQTIQAKTQSLLERFGRQLGDIEQCLINPTEDTTLSIIGVQTKTHVAAISLVQLTSLILGSPSTETAPFAMLDTFYDGVEVAQINGDLAVSEALATVFLAAFTTYLRCVSTWVATGCIRPNDQETFFVEEKSSDFSLADMWHKRFLLRADYLPKCMNGVAHDTFALGKSQSFLQSLEQRHRKATDVAFLTNAVPSIDAILHQQALRPFSQLLSEALESWLASVGTDCTPLLRAKLLQDHGLSDTLTALPYLYFSQDGLQFQAFANSLLEHVNRLSNKTTWSDHFLLTELAHDTLGDLPGVDRESIHVYITGNKNISLATSTTRKLGGLHLRYALPWAVQNITRCSTPKLHSASLSLLLQIYWARDLLSRKICDLRSRQSGLHDSLKLRQRLLCFIGILQSHTILTATVLHRDMRKEMEVVKDMDMMVSLWAEYEKRLQTSLLLAPKLDPLRDSIVGILELGELLSKTTRPENVKALRSRFDKSIGFVTAGIRSISRAGSESSLDVLAERLELSFR